MSTNQQKENSKSNNEEEVDLGSLFVIIGKGFSKFFNFIGDIFKNIFLGIIIILLFLKKHYVVISTAAIIGLIAGFSLEVNSPKIYTSDILLQTNFKSSRQLYNNISFYNDLIKQKDTLGLQKTFDLNSEYAISLKKFTIEPLKNKIDIISAYDELIEDLLDTLTVRNYDLNKFSKSFTDFDYKIHRLTVVAEKNDVFDKLNKPIISPFTKNKYFSYLKKLTNENINRTDLSYRQNLLQVDSLRKVYMKVMLVQANNPSNGTNIDFSSQKGTTGATELFSINKEINEDLKEITKNKIRKSEIINIISNFQIIGKEINSIVYNKAFQLAILFSLASIVILLLLKLNHYLSNYKNTLY
jgi:hypothetical protein